MLCSGSCWSENGSGPWSGMKVPVGEVVSVG